MSKDQEYAQLNEARIVHLGLLSHKNMSRSGSGVQRKRGQNIDAGSQLKFKRQCLSVFLGSRLRREGVIVQALDSCCCKEGNVTSEANVNSGGPLARTG